MAGLDPAISLPRANSYVPCNRVIRMKRPLTAVILLALSTACHAQTIEVTGPASAVTTLSIETLNALPGTEATLTYGNPPAPHRFAGPLLWTVLTAAHLVDPERHGDAVRQTLRIQGSDGYVAILAMGELSPEFENKPALLALTMDGKPLEHPRAVVTTDRRAGRSVRDVVRLTLDELPRSR